MRSSLSSDTSALHAGAARVEITPEQGILLGGDISRRRPAQAVEDPLWASALVLEQGGELVCMVSLDLVNARRDWILEVRRRAADRYDLRPEAVMVHVVHNHAAPELGGNVLANPSPFMRDDYAWIAGGDDRYTEPTVERIVDAIGRAKARVRPAKVEVGRALDGRWAFNRRFILRDGSRMSNVPPGDPNILRSEHPADPEVTVVRIADAQTADTIAAVLSYTCHPTLGYGRDVVIADWPGAWVELARDHFGGDAVPLVLNGCLGNIACKPRTWPGFKADYRAMAAGLFQTMRTALDRAEAIQVDALAHRQVTIDLPLRAPSQADMTWATDLLAAHPTPDWTDDTQTRCSWDWRYAIEIIDLAQTQREQKTFAYEINAIRMGSIAFVMLMGEPFVEAQFDLKLSSAADFTLVASLCNGYVGYLPTADAWGGAGFEVRLSNHAKLEKSALATVTREAALLLDGLFE